MRQGRKSRTAVGIGCALLVLAGCLAITPGLAAAQSAVDEYTSGDIPDPDSDEPGTAGGSSGSGDGSGGSAAPPPSSGSSGSGSGPTASAPVTEAGNDNSNGGNGAGHSDGKSEGQGQGQNAGAGGGQPAGEGGQPGAETPALTASPSSDDGGVPVFLILLAVIAAACTALAIWRMRRGDAADRQRGQAQSGGRRVRPPGETSQT